MQRHPAGYDPAPERSTNHFPAMGPDTYVKDVIGDLSFPTPAGVQMISKDAGDLCRTCLTPVKYHMTLPDSAVGSQPLGNQTPGIHPDTDTALNYAVPTRAQGWERFGLGRNGCGRPAACRSR